MARTQDVAVPETQTVMSSIFARPIILATDGSAAARGAGEAAAQFVRGSAAALHLIHAWTDIPTLLPTVPAIGLGRWASELQDDARQVVEREVAALRASGVTVAETYVRPGRATDVVADVAAEIGAGLIVVGSRGAGLIPRLLLGSVSEGLVQIAPCPVLVVRRGDEAWPPKTVLAGDDGSREAGAACAVAAAFARQLVLPLTIMRAYPARLTAAVGLPPAADALLTSLEGEVEARAEAVGGATTAMRPGDPAQVLLDEAEGPQTLIVVGTHGTGAISRLALGSVSRRVLHAHHGAVLVVPRRAASADQA